MKKSQLKGHLKDMENKNKKFSYTKTIRLLDVINYIYIDRIKEISYEEITSYKKSKFLFNEMVNQFEHIYELLDENKVLMAICLLRNAYEEIIYIMATAIDSSIEVNVRSNPSDFREIVHCNCDILVSKVFEKEDFLNIYSYLSKITHITNLKEATSYLLSVKKYSKYIANEIKFVTNLILYMYLSFLLKIGDKKEDTLLEDSILILSYVEIINLLYFIADSEHSERYLKKYFYGEKNQRYIEEHNEKLLNILNDFRVKKDDIDVTIIKVTREFDKLLSESKYLDIVNEIFSKK